MFTVCEISERADIFAVKFGDSYLPPEMIAAMVLDPVNLHL